MQLWEVIGEVLDNEFSTVESVNANLARTHKGKVKQTIDNAMIIFYQDSILKNAIKKNELTGKTDIVKELGWRRHSSGITDTDEYQIQRYLEKNYLGMYLQKKYLCHNHICRFCKMNQR